MLFIPCPRFQSESGPWLRQALLPASANSRHSVPVKANCQGQAINEPKYRRSREMLGMEKPMLNPLPIIMTGLFKWVRKQQLSDWNIVESFMSVPMDVLKALLYAVRHVFGAIQSTRPDTSDLGAIDKYYSERYSPRRKGSTSNSIAIRPDQEPLTSSHQK